MESPFALDGQDDLRMECELVKGMAGCSTAAASEEAAFLRKVGLTSADGLRGKAVLNWQGKGLTDADVGAFARLAAAHGAPLDVVEWFLGGNSIGDAGAALVAAIAAAAPELRDLELWGNRVGDAGLESLAGALRAGAMPRCESLCIANNPCSAQGRALLVDAVADAMPRLSIFFE